MWVRPGPHFQRLVGWGGRETLSSPPKIWQNNGKRNAVQAKRCLEERDRGLRDNQSCLLAGGMNVGDNCDFIRVGRKARGAECEEGSSRDEICSSRAVGMKMVWTLEVSPQLGIHWKEEKESLGRLAGGIQSNLPAPEALSPYWWPRVLGLWSRRPQMSVPLGTLPQLPGGAALGFLCTLWGHSCKVEFTVTGLCHDTVISGRSSAYPSWKHEQP